MTPHLVADEIRRRGHTVRHLVSWDDYDRYRKVPGGVEGVDETWAEHIGKPLTSVPAPAGSPHPNWAEHFKAAMVESLAELGVEYDPISQTEQYTAGAYREQILHAMRHRADIDAILDQYRTKKTPKKQSQKPLDEAELEAEEGSARPPRTTAPAAAPATSRTSPTAAGARRTSPPSPPTTTTPPNSPTPARPAASPRPSSSASSTAASSSGRSTGPCAGPTRA